MSQTLEQTNCSGYGLDVATWNDVIYLAVTCHTPEVTQVFTRRANDQTFSFAYTLRDKGNYRPCFFSSGDRFYLAVPNFSLVKDASMKIYRLVYGTFRTQFDLKSHSSYSVTVFEQHHDVYMFIARRMKLDIWQDGATVEEHLSWSPLFKFV
ncbi:hypothetical protein NP493_369g01024 [Ridgeia piscesae]|uniref:Uncharacterized protein n=1 Tax=Ridgeia piscesae TaxID=27915 RepID=A0AAD9NV96_RIDPI|nr:hypothetical protein NP493_369g01024 [Ridgeia piscesae]